MNQCSVLFLLYELVRVLKKNQLQGANKRENFDNCCWLL